MQSKFIALDIGGVCLQIERQNFFARHGLNPSSPELNALETEFECGRLDAAEWLQRIRQLKPALQQLSDQACWRRFRNIVGAEVPGIAEFISRLVRQGSRVIFFSNTSCVHADEVWRKISFADQISGAVYSYEAGFMKPSPEIYRCFEQRFGRPELYLDDNQANIQAARRLGWANSQLVDAGWLRENLQ